MAMIRTKADKYEGTIHDLGGTLTIEWKPSGEHSRGSTWGPFVGFTKAFTPFELDSINEALYHDPELYKTLLKAAKKSRFKRMLKED